MTKNDLDFAKQITNLDADIINIRKYIKENFGVNSEWDEENLQLNLSVTNVNESLQLMAAKEYIEDSIQSGFIKLNI